ncbi:pyrroloquinoline quinone biosynthesis peptide chaperone PqqD [Oceanobacter mangrovi]|uniref:pyrroloquinoline quinone biosynthesis peptide chaperone PqqD n=1 Tax=Oceanobacter mangrovi TaxID=2862510 RepID=UPI001FE95FB5|nr:pyrroloquinoline quinone biosynthesis peptide chaperone PqqD [Oceanobacter mangrovi]
MALMTPEQVPVISSIYRLQWEDSQQSHVLLYPEGMVQLNGSAGEIMVMVDGERSVAEIISALQAKFPEAGDLTDDIVEFLGVAHERQWIQFA